MLIDAIVLVLDTIINAVSIDEGWVLLVYLLEECARVGVQLVERPGSCRFARLKLLLLENGVFCSHLSFLVQLIVEVGGAETRTHTASFVGEI